MSSSDVYVLYVFDPVTVRLTTVLTIYRLNYTVENLREMPLLFSINFYNMRYFVHRFCSVTYLPNF